MSLLTRLVSSSSLTSTRYDYKLYQELLTETNYIKKKILEPYNTHKMHNLLLIITVAIVTKKKFKFSILLYYIYKYIH